MADIQRTRVTDDTPKFDETRTPVTCVIEACSNPATGRRCTQHQAQLESNLATLAGGAR